MKPIKSTAVARALIASLTVVIETMPDAQQRRSVNNVLRRAINNGVVDSETARILKHLVDDPQSRE
jgi:hypothetical protein